MHIIINAIITVITRLHRSTTYVDAAYCHRPSSMVCLPVGRSASRSVGLSQLLALQSWMNQSRYRLGCGLGWAQGIMC